MFLEFVFEVLTDSSLLPSLLLVWRRRKHFEVFMAVMQFVCSMMYNLSDAVDSDLFLTKQDWHRLTNVTGLGYGVNILVFLMMNREEAFDDLLRYAAFGLIWLAQIKDEYWMAHTQYTLLVIFIFSFFCGTKLIVRRKTLWAQYRKPHLKWGAGFALSAFIFFLLSLDSIDPFRWKHGVSQILFGAAVYHLWQVVPVTKFKSGDADDHVLPA